MARVLLSLSVALLLLSVSQSALAVPAYCPGTGHSYEVVLHMNGDLTWQDVRAEAEARTYAGVNGYLATILSSEENDFLALLGEQATAGWQDDQRNCFIGAVQPPGSPGPSEGWTWITGEAWSFSKWKPGEPNGDWENVVQFVCSDLYGYLGQWNDVRDETIYNRPWSNYIVEYPVPEPATLALLALGGSALLARRRGR